ncbi:hypothetical protein [Halospeciosus flavus]|uniref:hypothetical protein n=1 Tax=Halospeciosus flavus TaxID=3032283 RepID=UPI0036193265
MRSVASLFVISLLLVSAVGPVAGVAAPDGSVPSASAATGTAPAEHQQSSTAATAAVDTTAQSDIVRDVTLHLTPDDSGHVRAVVTYRLPDSMTALRVYPSDLPELQSADGFSRESGHYAWDGTTESPRLVFRVPVNRSLETSRSIDGARDTPANSAAAGTVATATAATARTTAARSGFSFVDTGSWAIVPVPQFRTEWEWRGSGTVRLDRRASVAGSGATGGEMAYLGEYTEYTASGNGQHFRLVVPTPASMRESPDAVLRALVNASAMLRVGARDETVFFVAAPTSVQWGPAGLEYGGSDAWVSADSPLASASNVWFHEYVHTRQAYRTTTQTKWTTEAIAEYYSAFLTLRQDRIGFDAFRDLLARGSHSPYAGDVLVDPSTWDAGTPYYKGGLVFGGIDRRTRLATGSRHTAMDVFAQLNRDTDRVTADEFYTAVGDVAGPEVREFAVRYTQQPEAPRMWSYAEHREAFGETPPRIEYGDATYRVTGDYRNATVDTVPTLVVGETLRVTVPVKNTGGTTGEYEVTLGRNESVVAQTGDPRPERTEDGHADPHVRADRRVHPLVRRRAPRRRREVAAPCQRYGPLRQPDDRRTRRRRRGRRDRREPR